MKTKIIRIILPLCLIFVSFSSCVSIHKGSISPSSVELKKTGFKVVKTLSGESSATYILGIGGNNPKGLFNEAKKNMYSSYNLKENQVISNIVSDVKQKFFLFPIYYKVTLYLSADVFEFNDSYKETLIEKNSNKEIINPTSLTVSEKNNISLTEDEIKINSFKENKAKKESIIKSADELSTGDVVVFKTQYGESVFGIVNEIKSPKKIAVKTFPTPGTMIILDIKIDNTLKIE
jgi:hypothetical protein